MLYLTLLLLRRIHLPFNISLYHCFSAHHQRRCGFMVHHSSLSLLPHPPLSPRYSLKLVSRIMQTLCLFYIQIVPHRPTSYSLRLPVGWCNNVAPFDREWIGRTMYAAKGRLVTTLKLWWNPPPVDYLATPPHPDTYHCRRLLLWAPRMMWKVNFHCHHCGVKESLRSKGLYNRVRLVVDMKGMYYLAGEYMDCRACMGTWDQRMLQQLADGVRVRFPVLLTHKYAVTSQSVVALLRSRTLSNSPTTLATLYRSCIVKSG